MKINNCTLGGFPIYDAPVGYGKPVNILQWRTGAARFGIGLFLMEQADYFSLTSSNGFNGKTTLIMQGGQDVTNNVLNIQVRVSGFQVAKAGAGPTTDNMVEVLVQDLRGENITPVQKAYNVPQQPFTWASSDYNYWNSTLNMGAAWTWGDATTDAELPSLPSAPSWKPRNLIFDNIPFCRVLDEVAARLFIIPGWNGTANKYYTPGQWDSINTALFDKALAVAWFGGDNGDREQAKNPATIDVCFPANGQDPFTQRFYIKNVTVGGGSNTGPKQALHLGDTPAIASGSSSWANQSDMDTIAADMAARFYAWLTVKPGEYLFAGIWPFILDGAIRHIEWISDKDGARTRIVLNNERFFSPLDDYYHSTILPTNQLVLPLGSSFVSTHGGSNSKFMLGGGNPQVLVQVTGLTYVSSVHGTVTLGIGKYAGNLWKPATTDDDATATLAQVDLGTAGSGTILIYNTSEVGETERHIDVSNSAEAPIIFPAVFLRTRTDDNTPIYVIVDANWGSCSN